MWLLLSVLRLRLRAQSSDKTRALYFMHRVYSPVTSSNKTSSLLTSASFSTRTLDKPSEKLVALHIPTIEFSSLDNYYEYTAGEVDLHYLFHESLIILWFRSSSSILKSTQL